MELEITLFHEERNGYFMIRISRQTRYIDSLRSYKIYIDDIYCGNIKDGEIKELDIENGEHMGCTRS